jgi:hypothetical protein
MQERLPIAPTLSGAVRELVVHYRSLLRALLIPAGLIALARLYLLFSLLNLRDWGSSHMKAASVAFFVTSGVAAVLIAISCHRIILLGAESLPNRWGVYWTRRELAFLGRVTLFGLVTAAPLGVLRMFPELLPYRDGYADLLRPILFVWWLLIAYPVSRLSLTLPATATDNALRLSDAWRASRHNGWRLTLVLLPVPLFLRAFHEAWALLAPPPDHVVLASLGTYVFGLLGALEIAALSCSYRSLSRSIGTVLDSSIVAG